MLKIKELLRKKDAYELFLLSLQETFEITFRKTSDNDTKRWLKKINHSIDEILEIKENKNIENLMKELEEDK